RDHADNRTGVQPQGARTLEGVLEPLPMEPFEGSGDLERTGRRTVVYAGTRSNLDHSCLFATVLRIGRGLSVLAFRLRDLADAGEAVARAPAPDVEPGDDPPTKGVQDDRTGDLIFGHGRLRCRGTVLGRRPRCKKGSITG